MSQLEEDEGRELPEPTNEVEYHTKLVGVTFEGRQDIIKTLKGDELLRVRREPDNQYDPGAVAVDVFIDRGEYLGDTLNEWRPIGYIAKDKNKDIANTLDAGNDVEISLSSLTGGDDKSYGVNVYLEYEKVTAPKKVKKPVAKEVEQELTPKQKLQLAVDEFTASFTQVGQKKKYTSRLIGKSTEVTVIEGHVSLPGYLSGSGFPKKFYQEFDETEMLNSVVDKHYPKATAEKKEAVKQALLSMWGLNRDASTGYGTAIHAALENFITYQKLGDKTKKVETFKTKPDRVGPNKALSRNPFLKKIVEDFWEKFGTDHIRLCEQFIWTHEESLCGSIDLVKVIDADKKIIRIQDFKTDGDIHEMKYQNADSIFRGVGKKALKEGKKEKPNTVEDTLLGLHWLQLSFYAYILTKYYGYTVEGLDIYWLNPEKLCKGENAWEEFSHDVINIEKGL